LVPPVFEPVGAKNPLIKQLRRLSRRRSSRVEEGQFLVEGPTLLGVALDAGAEVQLVVSDGGAALDPGAEAVAARAAEAGARLVQLPPGALAKVTDTVTPQPLAAVVTRTPVPFEALFADRDPTLPILVLVGVSDPGNAGTLLRSAEAAGASAVVFCAGSVDPFHPKTVRASAGSIFLVPVVDGGEPAAVLDALGERGVHRVGTVARGGVALAAASLSGPVAVVLGSEAHGLPEGLASRLDESVTIAMAGRAESLNVAMAGTLVVFEAARRRSSTPP
jgi:TrmH family RNA methyltransferase